jgi:hypothetical protein
VEPDQTAPLPQQQPPTARLTQHAENVHVGLQQPVAAPPITQQLPDATQVNALQSVPAAPNKNLVLSLSVVSRSDIARCLREVEYLEDFFHQSALRGTQAKDVPKLSQTLESLAVANQLNLIHAEDRAQLRDFLSRLKAKAPIMHMSFPSEAGGDFILKLLEWLRTEIHPNIVLHIGLQPELAAGCTVRTTNKVFDFSFRKRFEKSKQKLIAALEAGDHAEPAPHPPMQTAEAKL